jgi:hypothetical protein
VAELEENIEGAVTKLEFFLWIYTHMLINVRDKRKEIHNFTLYLYSKSIENEKIINIRFFNFVKLDPPVTKHSFEKS